MIGLHKNAAHPSDEALLLVADREASPRQAATVRAHLVQCPSCHARMAALEATLADFLSLHEDQVQSQPPHPGSRAAFKARLSSAGARTSRLPVRSPVHFARQFAAACVAVLLVAACVWAIENVLLRNLHKSPSDQLAAAMPRKRLTPGATRAVRLDDLCRNPESDSLQPVNSSLEQEVFAEYGLPVAAHHNYELDYLITPELGGSTDIHNLWPEPYSSTSWNAHVKDELENYLHARVCHGELPLSTAQDQIAGDWIAAYKHYFHTSQPLANSAVLESVPSRVSGTS